MAHAVKLEGGTPMVPEVELLVRAGIPVMGHIGFTPQSEHVLGGYRVQGRGDGADGLIEDALALRGRRGASRSSWRWCRRPSRRGSPRRCASRRSASAPAPHCDAQVLVWQDMAGLRGGRAPRFVKKYADLRGDLKDAAQAYAADVAPGAFPAAEHSFES